LGIQAASFGLDAADGAPADPAASQNALLRGIDLSGHRSARLESARLADGDLVIVFEPRQISEVRRRIGGSTPTELLGVCSRPVRPHIQDPYGMSDKYFQRCLAVIDANIAALFEYMARSSAPAISRRPMENAGESATPRNPPDRMLG
jgi:protein-tyrosine-phosphatase